MHQLRGACAILYGVFLVASINDIWASRRNGRGLMPAAWRSKPTISACCSPRAVRLRQAQTETCFSTTYFGESWEILALPTQPHAQLGDLSLIPLIPTVLPHSARSGSRQGRNSRHA